MIFQETFLFYVKKKCFINIHNILCSDTSVVKREQRPVTSVIRNYHQENMSVIVYPLKPHFYIVKLGFTGVYIFFLFLLQNIDCGYSLEPPRRGGSNVYPQSMF